MKDWETPLSWSGWKIEKSKLNCRRKEATMIRNSFILVLSRKEEIFGYV